MKSIAKSFLLYLASIYLVGRLFSGLSYGNDFKILLMAAIALAVGNLVIKPILKIISLPLSIITLGLFSWFIDAIILYLVTIFVEGFTINSFVFAGLSYGGFLIPKIEFSYALALIVCSFAISFIFRSAKWLFK